jgi:hypothetical protein
LGWSVENPTGPVTLKPGRNLPAVGVVVGEERELLLLAGVIIAAAAAAVVTWCMKCSTTSNPKYAYRVKPATILKK